MARSKDRPFNNPFADATLRRELQKKLPPERPPRPSPPTTPRLSARPLTAEQEADLWAEATRGGVPLRRTNHTSRHEHSRAHGGSMVVHPDERAWEALVRFARGEGSFDVADSDEFVEGAPGGLDPLAMQRLKGGEFSVQAYVDLHGLVVGEALEELAWFLRRARLHGHRCVLVVHGRGRHSKDGIAVIKERIVQWLSRGKLSRGVLGFCTARRHDGGPGALYVLLKERPERRRRRRQRRTAGGDGARGASQASVR